MTTRPLRTSDLFELIGIADRAFPDRDALRSALPDSFLGASGPASEPTLDLAEAALRFAATIARHSQRELLGWLGSMLEDPMDAADLDALGPAAFVAALRSVAESEGAADFFAELARTFSSLPAGRRS